MHGTAGIEGPGAAQRMTVLAAAAVWALSSCLFFSLLSSLSLPFPHDASSGFSRGPLVCLAKGGSKGGEGWG